MKTAAAIPLSQPSLRLAPRRLEIPPLENGAHLSASEFMRRYEASPNLKAELIGGIAYIMASPVSAEWHGEPDALLNTWLGMYALATCRIKHAINTTIRLGPDDVPQPDALLRLLPERGGNVRMAGKGYLTGAPELVVEIAASSASIDVRAKLDTYRRAGVQEYLVWRTEDAALDWWRLEDDEYKPMQIDADGILRSRAFPGLWLNVSALLEGNGKRLMAVLRKGLKSPEHAQFVKG
jgi:Uma2 family endonuclease